MARAASGRQGASRCGRLWLDSASASDMAARSAPPATRSRVMGQPHRQLPGDGPSMPRAASTRLPGAGRKAGQKRTAEGPFGASCTYIEGGAALSRPRFTQRHSRTHHGNMAPSGPRKRNPQGESGRPVPIRAIHSAAYAAARSAQARLSSRCSARDTTRARSAHLLGWRARRLSGSALGRARV